MAFPDLASGLYKELCTSTEFLKVHYTGMSCNGDPTRTWWELAGSVSGLGSSGHKRSECRETVRPGLSTRSSLGAMDWPYPVVLW